MHGDIGTLPFVFRIVQLFGPDCRDDALPDNDGGTGSKKDVPQTCHRLNITNLAGDNGTCHRYSVNGGIYFKIDLHI